MSSSNEPKKNEGDTDVMFMLKAMQQHFDRMHVEMNEMRDRIERTKERQERGIPQGRRQARRVPKAQYQEESENESNFEEDQGLLEQAGDLYQEEEDKAVEYSEIREGVMM